MRKEIQILFSLKNKTFYLVNNVIDPQKELSTINHNLMYFKH